MVYRFGSVDAYPMTIGIDVIDKERPSTDNAHVKFLHPSNVHEIVERYYSPAITGYPVDPATMPRRIAWKGGKRKFPDVEMCQGVLLVSDGIRSTIERFEPGVHQLLPVDVFTPKAAKEGGEPFARVYWLVVGQRLESISAEHSVGGLRPLLTMRDGSKVPGFWDFSKTPEARIVFDKGKIAGRHMWVEVGGTGGGKVPYLSNDLGTALESMSLFGAGFVKFDEL